AHVKAQPALTCATSVNPVTSTGIGAEGPDVPVPNSPFPFDPQHFTVPIAVTAHVCSKPAAIWTTPLLSPATSTGDGTMKGETDVKVPLPNCPERLNPQHLTPPAAVNTHA